MYIFFKAINLFLLISFISLPLKSEILLPPSNVLNIGNSGLAAALNNISGNNYQSNTYTPSSELFKLFITDSITQLDLSTGLQALNKLNTRIKAKIILIKEDNSSIQIPIDTLFVTKQIGSDLVRLKNTPSFLCIHQETEEILNGYPDLKNKLNTKSMRDGVSDFLNGAAKSVNGSAIHKYSPGKTPSWNREADAERALIVYLLSDWSQKYISQNINTGSNNNNSSNNNVKKVTLLIHGSAFTCGACSRMFEILTNHFDGKLEIIYKADQHYQDANYRGKNHGESLAPDVIRTSGNNYSFYIQFWKGQSRILTVSQNNQNLQNIFAEEVFWDIKQYWDNVDKFLNTIKYTIKPKDYNEDAVLTEWAKQNTDTIIEEWKKNLNLEFKKEVKATHILDDLKTKLKVPSEVSKENLTDIKKKWNLLKEKFKKDFVVFNSTNQYGKNP